MRDSREDERKRLMVPRVSISSVVTLEPNEEEGAMGDEERRRKGLKSFFGLSAQLADFLCVVGEDEVMWLPVGVIWLSGVYASSRVARDVFRLRSGGVPSVSDLQSDAAREPGDEKMEEEDRLLHPASLESTLRRDPLSPAIRVVSPSSAAAASSSALGSGSGAKRILRALGMDELRC